MRETNPTIGLICCAHCNGESQLRKTNGKFEPKFYYLCSNCGMIKPNSPGGQIWIMDNAVLFSPVEAEQYAVDNYSGKRPTPAKQKTVTEKPGQEVEEVTEPEPEISENTETTVIEYNPPIVEKKPEIPDNLEKDKPGISEPDDDLDAFMNS